MQSKIKNTFGIIVLLFIIITLTTTIHKFVLHSLKIPLYGFFSNTVETILLLFASAPLLLIIAAQHKQLVRSEEKYRSLVEHNSALICEFNLDGKLINANPILMEATGYALEDILDKSYRELVVDTDAQVAAHYFARAVKGELLNFELTVRHKSGRNIELGLKSVPIFIGNKITGLFFIAKDITERKKSLQQLKLIKHQLESFINHSSEAICLFDFDGKILQANQAYENLFGWSEKELVGQYFPGIPTDLKPTLQQVYSKVMAKEQVTNYETMRYRKNGGIIYVSLTFSPILDAHDHVIALAAIIRDITERKKMEIALGDSEEKYRLIAENMSDYIALLEPDGRIRYASESHKNIEGFSLENVIGKYFHPDDQRKAYYFFKRIHTDKTPQTVEFRTRHIKGYWMTLETSGKPIINAEGDIESIIIVSRDITERKKAEELLLKSEKLSVAGQLAAGVAHEIRNPLTTLRGFVQLMMNSGAGEDRYLQIMLAELDRINLIVGEFLILSKPHLRNFAFKDVRMILQDVKTLLEPQAHLSNIGFDLSMPNEEIIVGCEENELKQVFINILKNAMEAMPAGGNIRIEALRDPSGEVALKFTDEGCGISAENLQKLGEPFFTTKDKGTGLGMMITYKIIEDHHGKISIHSRLDVGTTVEILLPIHLNQVFQLT